MDRCLAVVTGDDKAQHPGADTPSISMDCFCVNIIIPTHYIAVHTSSTRYEHHQPLHMFTLALGQGSYTTSGGGGENVIDFQLE